MNRIYGTTLLVIVWLCSPCFAQDQTLKRLPAPAETKAPQAPVLPEAQTAPSAPAIEKGGAATPGRPGPSPGAKPRGALRRQGDRLFFRLDRPAAWMEVYTGKKKLGRLGGGLQFDLTPYLGRAGGAGLTLKYEAAGKQYVEEVDTARYRSPATAAGPRTPVPQPDPGTPQPPPSNLGTLVFQNPRAGDHFFQDTDVTIRLQGQGYIPEPCYGLYLYQGGTRVTPVVLQKCGPTHTWHVPGNISGTDFRLRVVTLDSRIMAESASFPILSAAPDLAVSNTSLTPADPDTADTVTFRATVSNNGQTQADGVQAEITVQAPDNTRTTYPVTLPRLAFGEHRLVAKAFRLPRAGQYSMSLNARVTLSTAAETRLDNNTAGVTFQVAGLPDLRVCMNQIQNVQIDHWEYIDVKVENIGEASSSSTTLKIWIDNRGTETLHVPGLIPGSHNMGSRYEMWISRNPSRDYWAEVDPDHTVRESNEDNNRETGVIVKHLGSQPDSNYRCTGIPITGYPVYEMP